MSKTEKKVKKVETVKDNSVENTELAKQLKEMQEEINRLKADRLSENEKNAIEVAREEMITDDELGPCYIDPKYKEEGYSYRITDTTRPGKIRKMLKIGYEIVYEDGEIRVGDNTVMNQAQLTGAVIIPLGGVDADRPGVLMRIPTERYDRRQKTKARDIQEQQSALFQGMAEKSEFGEITIGNETYKK